MENAIRLMEKNNNKKLETVSALDFKTFDSVGLIWT